MTRPGDGVVPVSVGVDLGLQVQPKPRIRWDAGSVPGLPAWVCFSAGCAGWGRTPLAAYTAWDKDRCRMLARCAMQARTPVTLPTLAQLRADLAAAYRDSHPRGSWWSPPPLPGPSGGRP